MAFAAVERLIAFRYLRARREEGFISVIAGFSLIGITLGVGTLIVVMSVMNGFRVEMLRQMSSISGQLGVQGSQNGLDALGGQRVVKILASAGHGAVVRLQVDDGDLERRHRLRPDDAGLVMARLDDAADQARHADAIGAHLDRNRAAIRSRHIGTHGARIFGAEIEDVADLNPTRREAL